ncbi:DUF948 domain-containing protein [Virgibacillus sp. NKC19-3]|uniref:DUF948 domain-containing protein n=1 Tax=Virgibacillus saliphilus TaxID=2831674 RepID=UPI001C9B1D22|nr:DUF948 domain-containing protein [Virgibacillus sp. NKC19-3]MBY7141819.1 DUF948 domain-containing protein [Virgibacillus sp. NKC19-3]
MDWLGIGVLVLGVAFLALVIVLIKPLMKLSGLLGSLQKTTDKLPQSVDDISSQATEVLTTGNDTLNQLNTQIRELNPILHIVGDAGKATRKLSSSMVDATEDMKTSTAEGSELVQDRNLEGLYGALTLGYYIFQKQRNK